MKTFPIVIATLLTACGAGKDANHPAPGSGDGTVDASDSAMLLGDQEAAGQEITAQVDTGVSALVDENPTASTGAALADAAPSKQNDVKRFRQCTVQGNDAVVEVRQSVERDFSFQGPKREADATFASFLDKQRTWSRADGAAVPCDANGEYADIQTASMAGVVLDAKFTESRGRQVSASNKATGRSVSRSWKLSETGSRHVEWAAVTLNGSTYDIQKSASHNLQRSLEIHGANGNVRSYETTVENASGAAFQILVERDQKSLDVTARTIQSGTLEATHKDGTRVETVFKNVRYEPSTSCMAVSGEIDGSIFKNGETTASMTYTITFADDQKVIKFSNGKTVEYTPDGCALDEDDSAAQDSSKDAVTAPAAATPAPAN